MSIAVADGLALNEGARTGLARGVARDVVLSLIVWDGR